MIISFEKPIENQMSKTFGSAQNLMALAILER